MARRGGGFPGGGGMGNMNNLMKQAQKMQRVVEVTVSGKKEITKIKLSEEVVDPDDIETLEDLIMAATNEALRQMDEKAQTQMSKITGGMGGGLPF